MKDLAGGNLCLQPARFALAMQDAGWVLRSRIIWAKGLSFCDEYAGSVMPESVNGWRWERCRVKTRPRPYRAHPMNDDQAVPNGPDGGVWSMPPAEYADCPGCEKCEPNGGYVLRQGSWRPTSAYEEILLFAKQGQRYYCDGDAVREDQSDPERLGPSATNRLTHDGRMDPRPGGSCDVVRTGSRNLRNVWAINPQPFPEAHFATYPEKLIEPIIRAATSEKGVCPECGAPWARVVETSYVKSPVHGDGSQIGKDGCPHGMTGMPRVARQDSTLGWRPTCRCGWHEWNGNLPASTPDIEPATVLDPFGGSGTTGLVARKLGRNAILIELNPDYAAMARRRCSEYAPLFQ
jgi:hypothetical protein